MPDYEVNQGECIYSIAAMFGLPWEKIWNDEKNADLRQEREDPNMLLPGDIVYVPDLTLKDEARGSDAQHGFKVKPKATLKIRVLDNGDPCKNMGWKANIDGQWQEGTTDDQGKLEIKVLPRSENGLLRMENGMEYTLMLRCLDPLTTVTGVQQRLNNMGYECGAVDGIQGPVTTAAIKAFQADNPPLDVDGIVGPKTRAKLKEVYGC